MELGPDVPVVVGIHYEESPDLPFLDLPLAGAFPDHALKSEPAFIETFQQIIDGLPEQIALVDEDWTILAVNPAWTRTAALYDYGELTPGANYLAFCEKVAVQGHNPAGIAAKGIRDMKRNGQPSFSFVYHGKDRWEGFAFQLCVKWIEVAGRTMYTVTRYDVSELVHLRQMREEFSHSLIEHQDEERRRMAREVHDSTMQLVASLGLSLGQIRRSKSVKSRTDIVDEMEDLLAQIHRELRAIGIGVDLQRPGPGAQVVVGIAAAAVGEQRAIAEVVVLERPAAPWLQRVRDRDRRGEQGQGQEPQQQAGDAEHGRRPRCGGAGGNGLEAIWGFGAIESSIMREFPLPLAG